MIFHSCTKNYVDKICLGQRQLGVGLRETLESKRQHVHAIGTSAGDLKCKKDTQQLELQQAKKVGAQCGFITNEDVKSGPCHVKRPYICSKPPVKGTKMINNALHQSSPARKYKNKILGYQQMAQIFLWPAERIQPHMSYVSQLTTKRRT